MKLLLGLLLVVAVGMPQRSAAQDSKEEDRTNESLPNVTSPASFTFDPSSPKKEIYWKGWLRFAPNVLKDQKQIWSFPFSLAKGRNLKSTVIVVGLTAGLVALDPFSGKYFQDNESYNGFNRVLSGPNTALAMEIIPTAFYGISLLRRDSYGQKTFLLAGEAVLSSEILTTVMKDITRRLNPGVVPINGSFSDTWFKKKEGSWIRGIGSFPSGHTIAAFSIATVFAKRYPRPRWFPWVAYSLAALVGFSRISLETHFPSDVFLGAYLGYTIAQNAVRRGP
jgi:membrane-associated phospholipid phosphatase